MQVDETLWPLVLAAGEGSRLRELTTDPQGIAIPKQFCSLQGGASLLQDALDRAAAVASPAHTVAVVASQHRRWWSRALAGLPSENIVVQPANKGTANGILLPLLHIVNRDPGANVVLLPSDHFVEQEGILASAMRDAGRHAADHPDELLLLGLAPDEPDPELGYILPATTRVGVSPVARFLEKPPVTVARELIANGGLWNILIVASTARALLALFMARYPGIVSEMQGILRSGRQPADVWISTCELYDRLPTLDFSKHVLEGREANLQVLRVPRCGWSDLGTPKRVRETLHRLPAQPITRHAGGAAFAPHINLAAQYARYSSLRQGTE
jgi:mannose-1-phosphate guanylyltransferase